MKRIKISESELNSLDALASTAKMEWFITEYGCRDILMGDYIKPCRRVRKTLPLDAIQTLCDGAFPENFSQLSSTDTENCNAVFARAGIR